MAVFGLDEDNTLDWGILQDGGISVYRNPVYLQEDICWLKERAYVIFDLDCRTWTSESAVHDSLEDTLSFPAYYGRNYNALMDCLRDVEVPFHGGVVIVLRAYDVYCRNTGSAEIHNAARAIIDILAKASRYFLLTGRRFIVLVQSNDSHLHFDGLAGVATQWNRREWFHKDRGI